MPEHDVYTEHDPREPVVGHAHVDEDAVVDPDTEPVGDAPTDGTTTTYESAAHTPDDSYVADSGDSFGRAKTFGDETEADAEHDRAADEATAGENGFGDRPADDEAFRERTADDTAFEHEAHEDDSVVDATTDTTSYPDDETVLDHDDAVVASDDTVVNNTTLDGDENDREALADGSAVDDTAVDHVTADDADTDSTGLTYTGDVADLDTDTSTPDEDTAVADAAAVDGSPAVSVPEENETVQDQALKPGAVDATPLGKLWADADVDGMKARWRDLQLKFLDDPQEVAGEAEGLVAEAVDALTAALNSRKDALSTWRGGDSGSDDTEKLRVAVRQYRDFFDQLLDL